MSPPVAQPALPIPAETADALARLTQGLDSAGLWWLSGYAAGLASRGGTPQPASAVVPRPDAATAGRLTIVYGSQTGNARRVAERLAGDAEAAGQRLHALGVAVHLGQVHLVGVGVLDLLGRCGTGD